MYYLWLRRDTEEEGTTAELVQRCLSVAILSHYRTLTFLHDKFEAQRVIGQSKNLICLIDPQEKKYFSLR